MLKITHRHVENIIVIRSAFLCPCVFPFIFSLVSIFPIGSDEKMNMKAEIQMGSEKTYT